MKHWKQHIGIVGTEAKINQEELVKSRRKIWSLPLAMVTALLLVGLLGAAVLAQSGRNATPRIASLDDVEVRLNADVGGVDDAVAIVRVDLGTEGKITDATTWLRWFTTQIVPQATMMTLMCRCLRSFRSR